MQLNRLDNPSKDGCLVSSLRTSRFVWICSLSFWWPPLVISRGSLTIRPIIEGILIVAWLMVRLTNKLIEGWICRLLVKPIITPLVWGANLLIEQTTGWLIGRLKELLSMMKKLLIRLFIVTKIIVTKIILILPLCIMIMLARGRIILFRSVRSSVHLFSLVYRLTFGLRRLSVLIFVRLTQDLTRLIFSCGRVLLNQNGLRLFGWILKLNPLI